MRDGKERDETGRDFPYAWVRVEGEVEDEVSRFMKTEPSGGAPEKLQYAGVLGGNGRSRAAEHQRSRGYPSRRGTHVAAVPGKTQQLL